jgi:small subunit ribosomal protein S16
MGKKKQPFYRIVAIDSRVARDGKYLDNVGTYNPRTPQGGATVQLDSERAVYWLSKGAKPSDTVRSLLRRQGILMRLHLQKLGMEAAQIEEAMKQWEAQQAEQQKRQEALREQKKRQRQAQKSAEAPADSGASAPAAADAAPASA